LTEDVVTSGEEPMTSGFETVADNLHLRWGDGWAVDPVVDDQSLYIRTDLGLVVVLGCAHRGIMCRLRWRQRPEWLVLPA